MLTTDEANAIYDVLSSTCGASNTADARRDFVDAVTDPTHAHLWVQYSFGGLLGLGGKFYAGRAGWRVSCYPREETMERYGLMDRANKALADLFAARKQEPAR